MTAALAPVRLREVLHVARSREASDLHLSPGAVPILRVEGRLEVHGTVITPAAEIAAIAEFLLDENARRDLQRNGDVSLSFREESAGPVRVHAYATSAGTALAIRMLSATIPQLETLRLPPAVEQFAERTSGLALVAGPTGSGKSTALAALIDRINRLQAKHVITIEDPIEYAHRSLRSIVSQRQVGRDVPAFSDAVYGALRSDPDVIAIGEMRDPATMLAALTAAETGHLVLATLHTGDAPQTIDRIVGVFPGEMQEQIRLQLAQTLVGIVCLRLVARACGRGRICAAEVLLANDAVRNLIRDGKTHQLRNTIATSRQTGMQTLETHLTDLVAGGAIGLVAARAAAERPDEVRVFDGACER